MHEEAFKKLYISLRLLTIPELNLIWWYTGRLCGYENGLNDTKIVYKCNVNSSQKARCQAAGTWTVSRHAEYTSSCLWKCVDHITFHSQTKIKQKYLLRVKKTERLTSVFCLRGAAIML